MLIKVRVHLGCLKQKFERFGNSMYIISLVSKDHDSANVELVRLLSRNLGLPPGRIVVQGGMQSNDKMVELR